MCWRPNPNSGNLSWLVINFDGCAFKPNMNLQADSDPWTLNAMARLSMRFVPWLLNSKNTSVDGGSWMHSVFGKLEHQEKYDSDLQPPIAGTSATTKNLAKTLQYHENGKQWLQLQSTPLFSLTHALILLEGRPRAASCSGRATIYARRFTWHWSWIDLGYWLDHIIFQSTSKFGQPGY